MLGVGSVRMAGWCSDEVMGDGGLRVESEERCCILNEGTRCREEISTSGIGRSKNELQP